MSSLDYDRNANAVFRARVEEWSARAPDEVAPRSGLSEEELVAGFLLGNIEAMQNARFVEEPSRPGYKSLHYDGYRTPVAIQGDSVLVNEQRVGRIYAAYGGVVDLQGVPLSPQALSQRAFQGLDLAAVQEQRIGWYPSEQAFFNDHAEHPGEQWDCGSWFEEGAGPSRYRLTWLSESKELYLVDAQSNAVEVLSKGMDHDRDVNPLYLELIRAARSRGFGDRGDVEQLREKVADWRREQERRPQLSSQTDLAAASDSAGPDHYDGIGGQ